MSWFDFLKRTRSSNREKLLEKVVTRDPTAGIQAHQPFYGSEILVNNLPPFHIRTGRLMLRSDPIVNFALNVRNAALMVAEVEITAKNEAVRKWVQKQWDTLWDKHRNKILATKAWGFQPLQLVFKYGSTGLPDIEDVKDFAPEDCRAQELGGKVCGFKIKDRKVFQPQALWMTFNSEYGSPYGTGCLRRQYPPWFEKWTSHGSKKLGQLRMIKDAYIGDIFWYPKDQLVEIPLSDGTTAKMSWRDLVRELGENRLSGNAMYLPSVYDDKEHKLLDYTPPQGIPGASQVFDWEDRHNNDILRGADVPLEVIEASETGSGFSGRSIPFMVVLSVCTGELTEYVQAIDVVLREVAWLIWGGDPEFEIKPKSLVESFAADASGSPMGGGAIGGQPGQAGNRPGMGQQPPPQMSQKQNGQGRVQFSEGVEFDKENRTLHAPPGGVTIHGVRYEGGEFIPKEVIDALDEDDRSQLRAGTIARHIKEKPDLSAEHSAVQGQQKEFASDVYSAVQKKFDSGESVIITTSTKRTQFSPKHRDLIRLSKDGTIQIRRGKSWDNVRWQALDHLAAYVGVSKPVADDDDESTDESKVQEDDDENAAADRWGEFVAKHFDGKFGSALEALEKAGFSDSQTDAFIAHYASKKSSQFDEGPEPLDEPLNSIALIGAASARSRIRGAASRIRALKKNDLTPLTTLGDLIEQEITALRRGLSSDLSASMLGGQLTGMADAWATMPVEAIQPVPAPAFVPPSPPEEPPPPSIASLLGPDEPTPNVTFPVVEDALEVLADAPALARPDFRATAAAVKEGAFAITGDLTDSAVADVRNLLAENLARGADREAFVEAVVTRLGEGGPLSEAHVENIFRTNVAAAMSDGQDRALKAPMVVDAFPYRAYYATSDTRVRKEHRALEKLGLDGTNIYRADDPSFIKFRPPWDFQCRCSWTPVTVEQAARRGVREAQEWLERAKAMAAELGGSEYQYFERTAPAAPQWVTSPDFEPSPEFERR